MKTRRDEPTKAPGAAAQMADLSKLEEAPSDPAKMKPGQIYRGSFEKPSGTLPPPVATKPEAPLVAAEKTPVAAEDPSSWSDVARFIAGHYSQKVEHSVLLVRGSTLAAPQWVPCGDKPPAVLIDLESVVPMARSVPGKIAEDLGVAETLQVAIVYTTRRSGLDLANAIARLGKATLHLPTPGNTLFPVVAGQESAVRANAGARFCIIAIAGDRASDFPNSALPGAAGGPWNAGWFFVPPSAP